MSLDRFDPPSGRVGCRQCEQRACDRPDGFPPRVAESDPGFLTEIASRWHRVLS